MKNAAKLLTKPGLLPAVRSYFGLTQAELAYLLGTSQSSLARDEAGICSLPPDASYRLRALARLVQPPASAPAAFSPTDLAALRARLAAAHDQARRLRYRLTHDVPARAAPAHNRLAAADALPAALAATLADAPLSLRQLEDQYHQWRQLLNAATNELEDRSGPGPAALLRARLAGLEAEAAALTQTLADAGAGEM